MRVLLAVRGSAHSPETLRFAAQITARLEEPLVVLTVIGPRAERARAGQVLDEALALLDLKPPRVVSKVRVGRAAEQILAEAREGDYDLVIVGQERPPAGVLRWLALSTALKVVEEAPCSVMIARGPLRPLRRILLCDSGAYSPSLLSIFAARLARMLDAEEQVTVLHVMSQISAAPGVEGAQLRADAEELMEAQAPEGRLLERDLQVLNQPHVRPRAKVRHGFVVDEILKEARLGDYDLIIIGAHRRRGWQSVLLENIARKIVIMANRPVLVVRGEGDEKVADGPPGPG